MFSGVEDVMPIVCRIPSYQAMALEGIFHSRRRESLLIADLGKLP